MNKRENVVLSNRSIVVATENSNFKKWFFSTILLALVLVSTFSFISSQNPLDDFADQMENVSDQIENTGRRITEISREDAKWDYLGVQCQELLLKNKVISAIDSFLKKGNIVFVFLFGKDYSLSLTLFFLILIWIFFWSQLSKIISTFSMFGSITSKLVALALTTILAQLGSFDWISRTIFKLAFYREGGWGLVWSIGIFIAVILISMIFGRFFTSLKRSILNFKEEGHKKQLLGELEQKNKFFGIVADTFRGMFSKG